MKASKVKVHQPPEPESHVDGQFHVYVFDVFNKKFLSGDKVFDTIEKAAAFQRHEQERIYAEQEADPELFDLPCVSADPQLIDRTTQDEEYRKRLMRALEHDARARVRHR